MSEQRVDCWRGFSVRRDFRTRVEIARRLTATLLAYALAVMPFTPMAASAGQQQDQRGQTANSITQGREQVTGFERRPSSSDLVSQNMARVAATPEQILAAVNKDSGLMVELKMLYAQEAGQQGQVLEEKDLTDAAVEARLRQDLRLRMLHPKARARETVTALM